MFCRNIFRGVFTLLAELELDIARALAIGFMVLVHVFELFGEYPYPIPWFTSGSTSVYAASGSRHCIL